MPDAQQSAEDRQRLTDMFRRHGDAVFAYASDRLGNDDAQDLVGEVFAVAWRRLATIRHGEERPWLFGVARRPVFPLLDGASSSTWSTVNISRIPPRRVAPSACWWSRSATDPYAPG
ncbi:hypothetical protein GCM10011608_30020 [Micromonospora sonchi]|uniref:RNA polymerase sigma-70 region 2 domain-containing protein n=1 Tax=Micromonospora sonchi TaxID=1763543 RepID=A0A917TXJ2_9ACTN|nr:hypothetical protein GCM10011608_30020 [Micromonospora sonchi]